MKSKIKFLVLYYIFWILFFEVSRITFLLYEFKISLNYPITDWFLVLFHGLKLDLSMAGYFTLIPGLLLASTVYIPRNIFRHSLAIYTLVLLLASSSLIISDLELYRNWLFRLDATPLLYLKTPKEALASSPLFIVITLTFIWILYASFSFFLFRKILINRIKVFKKGNWYEVFVFVFLTASLIIPIRGGFDVAPINVGAVYFHKDVFPNHAAINVCWNVGHSLSHINESKLTASYFDTEKAKSAFAELYNRQDSTPEIFNIPKPNIIIIILESFSGKVVKEISGFEGVTPNFSSFINEGIFFSNAYASGDRSDKGIIAILSGYPSQPGSTIIKFAKKIQSLPIISKDLKCIGYSTAFYYGGNTNFANMNSYLTLAGFDKTISKDDFPSELDNTKWGVHDQHLFERLFNDIKDENEPFFKTFFTLSCHEPFDVPHTSQFSGSDEDSKFLNAANYTDKYLGWFINESKKQSWWNNTIVILLPDHGGRLPWNTPAHVREKFHMPLLWLGGALAVNDTVIEKFVSQTDLSFSLLKQLKVNTDNYKFGKDIFADSSKSFAFYAFNNGFGFAVDSSLLVYSLVKKIFFIEENPADSLKTKAKAYHQVLVEDFNSR